MAILEADVKFRASQRMTDFTDGGGLMSTTVIVDGVDNNLFDDITDLQRLFGHLSLRKVYGAVLSNNSDTYISAHALVDVPPVDAATDCFIFATGGLTTERAAAQAYLQGTAFYTYGTVYTLANYGVGTGYTFNYVTNLSVNFTSGGSVLTLPADSGNLDGNFSYAFASVALVGSEVELEAGGVTSLYTVTARTTMAHTSGGAYTGTNTLSVTPALPAATSGTLRYPVINAAAARLAGAVAIPGGASSGATSIVVSSLRAVVDAAALAPLGQAPVIRATDAVLIHSTIAGTPAAVSNGSTTTTGRTNLSRLRVIGNNGVVHASFVLNQPAPSGVGCTADLTAGTVTFSNVSGYSQPVTVEHRIEEMSVVSSISGNTLTLNRALSRAYPAGTRVSSLLMLGDLKARVGVSFAQNAWTGVFADTVLGGSPAADYDIASNPIAVTNQGAVNERWYAQFTNSTSFTLVGEQLGVIGTFGTGSACAPTNPATGVPYFTIPSVGWGSGWAAGNVFRFNTAGANAPVWVGRSVAPSTPAGDDSVTLQLRGYVNT
jgi:hypothetical protein